MSGSEGNTDQIDTNRTTKAKGDSRDDGDDPAEEFEDDPDSEAAADAQQTVEAFVESDDNPPTESSDTPTDVSVETIDTPRELTPQKDAVRIELGDGEVVVGRVYEDNGDTLLVETNYEVFDPDNHEYIEIDKEQIGEGVQIERYDTVDMTQIPGVEPLPADEGGYNEIPSSASDAEELVAEIRTVEEWNEVSDINGQLAEQFSITESGAEQLRSKITNTLSQFRDDELKREYAKRTLITNSRPKPGNAAAFTENGRPINFIVKSEKGFLDGDIPHEMGHGITHMCGFTTPSSDGVSGEDSKDYWDTQVDPRNTAEFQQYMHTKSGVRNNGTTEANVTRPFGWDDWNEDAKSRLQTLDSPDSQFESVSDSIGRDLSEGDVVRFDERPFSLYRGKEWEVVSSPDFHDDVPQATLRNREGATHQVALIGDHNTPEETHGEFDADAQPTQIAKGYSDSKTAKNLDQTRFTEGESTPTVDELREQYSAESWEKKVDNFASQANRAFYEMHLRNAIRGEQIGIRSGYSAYHSQETIAQMNELFQTHDKQTAKNVKSTVKNYPEVTAAYLELAEPSETVRDQLRDIDGVTVD